MGFEKVVSQPERPEHEPVAYHPCIKPSLPEGAGAGTVWACDDCGSKWVWNPMNKSVVPKMVTYFFLFTLALPFLLLPLILFIPMAKKESWWQLANWRTYQIFCWILFLSFATMVAAIAVAAGQ